MSALDRSAFGAAVKTKVDSMQVPLSAAARAAGVTKAQLWRGLNGQAIDAGAFLALCRWAQLDPYAFLAPAQSIVPRETIQPSKRPEFRVWMNMIYRCTRPDFAHYDRYGGRGISVCPQWTGDFGFEAFFNHMGPRPSALHSIDRKDNDGNYEPGNCRWATRTEQSRNKSKTRLVEYQGRRVSVAEAAELAGSIVSGSYAAGRIKRGWPVHMAVTTPIGEVPEDLANFPARAA